MIDEAEQKVRQQLASNDLIKAAEKLNNRYCTEHNVSIAVFRSDSRWQAVSITRRQLVLQLVNTLGLSFAETGRQLVLTTSGIAQILRCNN